MKGKTAPRRNPASHKPAEGLPARPSGVSASPAGNLAALVGSVVRVYLRNKRSLSDGWHCGKLLKVAKGKAVIELRHKTVVAVEDVEEL